MIRFIENTNIETDLGTIRITDSGEIYFNFNDKKGYISNYVGDRLGNIDNIENRLYVGESEKSRTCVCECGEYKYSFTDESCSCLTAYYICPTCGRIDTVNKHTRKFKQMITNKFVESTHPGEFLIMNHHNIYEGYHISMNSCESYVDAILEVDRIVDYIHTVYPREDLSLFIQNNPKAIRFYPNIIKWVLQDKYIITENQNESKGTSNVIRKKNKLLKKIFMLNNI